MIPAFDGKGRLPGGGHICTWDELVARFGNGERRQTLCRELRTFVDRAKGCGFVLVGIWGSFTTAKADPGDLDLLFVTPRGTTREALSARCAELLMDDAAFKERFGHSAFNCHNEPDIIATMTDWLGRDYRINTEQGMLLVDLACIV